MKSSLLSLLLSDDPHLRPRLRLILLVAGVYAMSLLAQWHAVANGLADPSAALWLVAFIVIGVFSTYLLVRLGVTRHFVDSALTRPQMVFAILAIAVAYHINPLVRGALPMLAGLVIMFGAFSLTPRQARHLGWFAVAVFALVMAWGALQEPATFDPQVEAHHFLFVTVVLLTMSELTGQFSRLRSSWRQQNRDLKEAMDRLAEGQRVLEQAKAAAESANAAKSQFLANTSHEIRTPLNGILGMNELLLTSPLQPAQRAWVETARASGQHLLSVINDILDFSRIETGNLRLEQVDFELRTVIQDVVSMLKQPAQAKGLTLSADIAPPDFAAVLRGDPFRLRQIITNLVGNAVKFTDRGWVSIKVLAQPTGGGEVQLCITVLDTGIGISTEAQARIFETFSQGDGSTTRKYGGSGLGLAICRRLLTQMGGTLGVRSQPNAGAVFQIDLCLPLAQPSPGVPHRPADNPVSDYQPLQAATDPGWTSGGLVGKVLLVEDNPINQTVGLAMLGRLGLACEVAADGAQALGRVQEADFDLVLMDCQMPVMDGFEATRRIRQLPGQEWRSLPIVALTANTMPGDEQRCLDAGMVGFITKPFSMSSLHAQLSPWLALQAAPAATSANSGHAGRQQVETHEPGGVAGETPPAAAMLRAVGELDRSGGSGLGLEVLSMFLDNTPQGLIEAGAALSRGDADALAESAHTLKSGAAYVGADGLAQRLQTLECLARRCDLEQARAALEQIHQEHARVVDAARDFLKNRVTSVAN